MNCLKLTQLSFVAAFLIVAASCTKKKFVAEPTGTYLSYDCDLSQLGKISNGFGKRTVYFSEVERRGNTLYVLVSDERFGTSDAAVLFIVDTEKNRVDQIRTRDGKPFQTSLKLSLVTADEALGYVHSKVGMILIEGVSQAVMSSAGNLTSTPLIEFSYDGNAYASSTTLVNAPQFAFKSMSTRVDANKQTLCVFKQTVEKK